MAKDSIDPITLAVVKGALEQIVEEMDAIIVRAAFSPVISEQLDRSSGIFHPETGEVVAQGTLSPPLFVTAMQVTTQATLEAARQRGGFRPGDVYIVNNPYLAGTHLPDIKLVAPVFVEGQLIALLATCGHWNDIGGATPGGFAPTATEIHQEGLLLNPRPLYREGVLQEDFLGFLLDNVRMPEERRGDLNACIAALDVGKARMGELVERHGAATVLDTFQSLNDRSEQHMRSLIREIPDGTYRFRHTLDNDGQQDRELVIQLSATVRGDTIRFDFSGSSPPVRGAVNVPRKTCIAACQIAIKHLFPEVPINGGCFRPFEYEIPATTFLGVEYPYAISGYLESIGRVVSTVVGALNPGLPQRALADSISTTGVITMSGTHPQRNAYYVMLFPAAGGYGANAHGDGLVHGPSALGSANYPSVESVEHRLPVRVEALELRTDSGGAGAHRGGCGTRYVYRSLAEGVAVAALGDQHRSRPFGVHGGQPGAGSDVVFYGADGATHLPLRTKGLRVLNTGDVLEYRSPGGGGYGLPAQRAPEEVLRDVRFGYVAAATAREVYGVVLRQMAGADPDAMEVDEPATAAARSRMMKENG
ncbi:hydantoinase B/oxoprolinase family protein [Ramlibacter sp. G-1-2-2]|uniref:Hydantoinase B/oxoprolinase family protein n=1 Tax=Ramlibacter agri TaxID=2728837 RepID=A0A848H877_9BURK|nr:hydantoinase B/oxoprolinase family protein [Ramlibacter agri]NML45709.1 hydantoinase B/oxoprolinase family protein [Ramlibacter agri]